MRLRLPYSLIAVIISSGLPAGAAAVDTTGYTTTQIGGSTGKTVSGKALDSTAEKIAYVLEGDVSVDFKPAKSSYYYIYGDSYIFTSDNKDALCNLTFTGGRSADKDGTYPGYVFCDSALTFTYLDSLKMVYNSTYTAYHSVFSSVTSAGKKTLLIDHVNSVQFKNVRQSKTSVIGAGGLMHHAAENSHISLTNNGAVSFESISVYSQQESASGGVIYTGGPLTISENTSVTFNSNFAQSVKTGKDAYGGAVAALKGVATLAANDSLIFSENTVSGKNYACGGAIALQSTTFENTENSLIIKGNKYVEFSENSSLGENFGAGGAIDGGVGDNIEISNNTGTVIFEKNYATTQGGAIRANGGKLDIIGNSNVTFDGNNTRNSGGAIRAVKETTISGNTSVKFNGNYVDQGEKTGNITGGAISSTSDLKISNNGDVTFKNNYLKTKKTASDSTMQGAALCLSGSGSLIIEGNDSVLFSNNYEARIGTEYNPSYLLRSVYVDNANAENVLSAKTGGNITFEDSVYMDGNTTINSQYTDTEGQKQSAGGEVIFTGANTSKHLKALYGNYSYGDKEITSARTSELKGNVTVEGGSLNINSGAIVKVGKNLKATEASNAKLVVNNGTLEAETLNWNSGALEVCNNGKVTTANGGTINAVLKVADGTLEAGNADITLASGDSQLSGTAKVATTGNLIITEGSDASLNMSGGELSVNNLELKDGSLKLSGGKVTATTGGFIHALLEVTGGELSSGAADITLMDNSKLSGGLVSTTGKVSADSGATVTIDGGELKASELNIQSGTLEISNGGKVTAGKSSINSSLSVQGGTLEAGTADIHLSSGQTLGVSAGALVSANNITIDASAALHAGTISAAPAAAAFTLTAVDDVNPTVYGAIKLATLDADLTLAGGAILSAGEGNVGLNGHKLTFQVTEDAKIALTLPVSTASDPTGKVIIFSEVTMVNFMLGDNVAMLAEMGMDNLSISASDYFTGDWITDKTTLNFDTTNGLVYLQGVVDFVPTPPAGDGAVPEPSTSALALLALAGVLSRRRRK